MPVKQRRGKYKKLESEKGDKGDTDGPETRPKEDSIEVMNNEARGRIRSNDESDANDENESSECFALFTILFKCILSNSKSLSH